MTVAYSWGEFTQGPQIQAGFLLMMWDASPDALSYKIYWGTSTGSYTGSVNVGKNLSYALPDPGASYRFFIVKAVDGGGETNATNEITR